MITNDRWGRDCSCRHGGYYNCADRFTPTTIPNHKWEKCQNIDLRSWGYRRNMNLKEIMDLPSVIEVGELKSFAVPGFWRILIFMSSLARTWCLWWLSGVTTC